MSIHDMQFFFACTNIRMLFLLEVSKILLVCSQKHKIEKISFLNTLRYIFLAKSISFLKLIN